LLEEGFRRVWVEGEISNYKKHSSGHHYFTLKDAEASIACVLFANAARALGSVELRDGQSVCVGGDVSVYPQRGIYQIVVRTVKACGQGELQARFEALKKKLAAEGLFDTARKRPLPKHPTAIGLITSRSGAAIHDFLNVLWRRNPQIRVLLYPVAVQGRGAAAQIAEAIASLNRISAEGVRPLDLLVLTRGGGSLEDLWEFNEEIVARAIAASALPVISAVGHEVDFTIADFVADFRAPTPSAAAEQLSSDAAGIRQMLAEFVRRMHVRCKLSMEIASERLRGLCASTGFARAEQRLKDLRQELDGLSDGIENALRGRYEKLVNALERACEILRARHPLGVLARRREELRQFAPLFVAHARRALAERTTQLNRASALLDALSPNATLARGYTITFDATGAPITSAKGIEPGRVLCTRFFDGRVESVVTQGSQSIQTDAKSA
jgi:exodeoxyribonuclease VII large subunit